MGLMKLRKYGSDKTTLEKVLMGCVCVLCLIVVILFITTVTIHDNTNVCTNPQCVRAAVHLLDTINPEVDPCEDFYQFACGSFLKNAFSHGRSSTLAAMKELTKNQLKEIIVEKLNKTDEESLPRTLKVHREFNRACMNTTKINKEGDKIVLKLLDDIMGGWPAVKSYSWDESAFSWINSTVQARRLGVNHHFFLNIETYVLSKTRQFILWIKPPCEYQISSLNLRKESVDIIAEIATFCGATSALLPTEIRKTMDFARQLQAIVQKHYNKNNTDARYNFTLTLEEDDEDYGYTPTTIADLQHKYIKIDWLSFLRNVTGVPLTGQNLVIFEIEEYFMEFYFLLLRTPRKIQANFMAWLVITEYIHYMSDTIRDKYQRILKFGNETKEEETREEICLKASRELYQNVAEAEYIRRYTTPEKKSHIKEMITYIKDELHSSLQATTWLEQRDKTNALERLANITEAIGWSDIVFNISAFDNMFGYDRLMFNKWTTENVIGMARDVVKVRVDKYYKRLVENVTEMEILISSPKPEINAYYVRDLNTLILPTPILQSHIFDINRPQYMNYGALGTIIGHEFTHAFGSDSNEGSDVPVVWKNKTSERFHHLAECIDDEYTMYEAKITGLPPNDMGVEENVADYNGLIVAYRAYQKWIKKHGQENNLPGIKYTPSQIFWIMASTYMCFEPNLSNDKNDVRLKDTSHGIPSFRVVGRLRSSYDFAEDFKCRPDSEMNPKKKCQIFA